MPGTGGKEPSGREAPPLYCTAVTGELRTSMEARAVDCVFEGGGGTHLREGVFGVPDPEQMPFAPESRSPTILQTGAMPPTTSMNRPVGFEGPWQPPGS